MASPRPVRIRLLALVCVAACTVATALGVLAGVLGTYLYGQIAVSRDFLFVIPNHVGGWFGGLSGLVAALFWCRLIVPSSLRNVAGLRSMAGLAGLGAGALGALLLHTMLMLTEREMRLNALAVGLGMSAPAGLLLGVIGGHLCRLAVTTERAFRPDPRGRRVVPAQAAPVHDPMEQLDVRSRFHPRPDFRDEYDA
jgi:hypothetical protein